MNPSSAAMPDGTAFIGISRKANNPYFSQRLRKYG